MGVGSFTFSSHLTTTGVWGRSPHAATWDKGVCGRSPPALDDLGDLLPK